MSRKTEPRHQGDRDGNHLVLGATRVDVRGLADEQVGTDLREVERREHVALDDPIGDLYRQLDVPMAAAHVTVRPVSTPSDSASVGCISSTSLGSSSRLPVRRVIVPAL